MNDDVKQALYGKSKPENSKKYQDKQFHKCLDCEFPVKFPRYPGCSNCGCISFKIISEKEFLELVERCQSTQI